MTDTPATPRERAIAAEELRYAAKHGDVLSPMDRDIIGHGDRRLQVPLRDPVDLRRCAVILRELANHLEMCSGMRGDARSVLFAASWHCKQAAGRLRSKPTRNNR